MAADDALRTRLTTELARVGYVDLRPHAARGALFLVQGALGVVEAGVAVARDDVRSVSAWVEAGLLQRPTESQLRAWETQPDKRFDYVIVQPYVVAREADGTVADRPN